MSQILPIEMLYLSPLLEALNALDAEFFDGLAEAMRILQSYGEDPTNKWLIEHEEEIKGCTPEEIIKRFGSQFQVISSDKLHRRLNKLGLATNTVTSRAVKLPQNTPSTRSRAAREI